MSPADRLRWQTAKRQTDLVLSKTSSHQFFGLIAQIVDHPIVADALALRPEAKSAVLDIPTLTEAMKEYRGRVKWMGYRNIALTLTFNDGVRWLARVRLNDIYTPYVRRNIMLSEYATIQAVHDVVPKLVPQVWLPPQGE